MKNLVRLAFFALLANGHSLFPQELPAEAAILKEVRRLRQQSAINIVMDYDRRIQWNPLLSYTASEAQVHISLFEGVLAYNPVDMTPGPGLAESWENDGLRYTFYLRRNARFSNGDSIDANTITRTWFFQIRSGAPFSSLLDLVAGVKEYREGKIEAEETGIKVIRPYVLELRLEHPAPEILAILCHHSLSPLPAEMLVERDWAAFYRKLQSPVGQQPATTQLPSNGPYLLESVSEAGILLKANPYYWNAQAVLPQTVFIQKYYDWQDMDIAAALNAYKIDWVASGFSDFSLLRRGGELVHFSKSFSTTFFYFANSAKPSNPWSDPRVRTALALLLPLEKLRSGLGGSTHLVPGIPNFPSGKSLKKQNKEEAMRLLEAAGYAAGLGTLTLHFPEGPTYERFAELIQEVWSSELKSEVRVQYGDPAKMLEGDERSAEFTLSVLSWIGDYPDPTTFLNLWRSDSSLNLFGYEDPEYDQLLDRARQERARVKRFELLAQAEEHLLQNGTVIPLWHSPSFNLYDARFLDGFYPNVLDLHPLHTLRRIYRLPRGSA